MHCSIGVGVMMSPYRSADHPLPPEIVVTTGGDIPGCRIVHILGVVRGIALRRPLTPDQPPLEPFVAVRKAAELRMIEEAKLLNAEAVICMRYDSNDAEVVAYGTAVRLRPASAELAAARPGGSTRDP